MIQLAKNSTKARILQNSRKWGPTIMSLEIWREIIDTRIPVGISKRFALREVWAQCLPSKVESKTLREVMRF